MKPSPTTNLVRIFLCLIRNRLSSIPEWNGNNTVVLLPWVVQGRQEWAEYWHSYDWYVTRLEGSHWSESKIEITWIFENYSCRSRQSEIQHDLGVIPRCVRQYFPNGWSILRNTIAETNIFHPRTCIWLQLFYTSDQWVHSAGKESGFEWKAANFRFCKQLTEYRKYTIKLLYWLCDN